MNDMSLVSRRVSQTKNYRILHDPFEEVARYSTGGSSAKAKVQKLPKKVKKQDETSTSSGSGGTNRTGQGTNANKGKSLMNGKWSFKNTVRNLVGQANAGNVSPSTHGSDDSVDEEEDEEDYEDYDDYDDYEERTNGVANTLHDNTSRSNNGQGVVTNTNGTEQFIATDVGVRGNVAPTGGQKCFCEMLESKELRMRMRRDVPVPQLIHMLQWSMGEFS